MGLEPKTFSSPILVKEGSPFELEIVGNADVHMDKQLLYAFGNSALREHDHISTNNVAEKKCIT